MGVHPQLQYAPFYVIISLVKKKAIESSNNPNNPINSNSNSSSFDYVELLRTRKPNHYPALTLSNITSPDREIESSTNNSNTSNNPIVNRVDLDHTVTANNIDLTIWDVSTNHTYMKGKLLPAELHPFFSILFIIIIRE